MKTRAVGINEKGIRVGQWHQNAKLTDAECEKLVQLHEEGLGYKRLAKMFDVSVRHVRDICSGKKRQVAVSFKAVPA